MHERIAVEGEFESTQREDGRKFGRGESGLWRGSRWLTPCASGGDLQRDQRSIVAAFLCSLGRMLSRSAPKRTGGFGRASYGPCALISSDRDASSETLCTHKSRSGWFSPNMLVGKMRDV